MTGLLQLLLLVYVTVASEPSCPACSKYDYEEKVLERMIRMEFAFENVLKENKAVSKTVEEDLTRIKEENTRLHATVDVLKDQQEQAERRLVSLMEEIERNQSSILEKIVSDSNTTLEQTIAAFNDMKDQIATPLVYFNAHFPQTTSLSTGEVIVYKTVETNQGSGYSATTGKFTAPERGLYLFFMHTCTSSTKYSYLQIVKDGSVLIRSVQYENNASTCSSSQVFVLLDVGETVWVQCSSGGLSRQLDESHSYRWTSFGGAIIRN
ncbi:heavy metal-binding protein HIP-like [Mya arenaria]|uniref:heavy metal-binding protein HIP-like n=1 Tax=Mya arenaria TaxID=6604 RepID=UPI0022E33E7E|nr:heavy metal-binding protein HIP-like [Mya arenaria]